MINFLEPTNIRLADYVNSLTPDVKNVALFAMAYSTFNVMSENLSKEDMVANSPAIGILKTKIADCINELIIIDREVFKNYLVKFAEYNNAKINNGSIELFSTKDIFNTNIIFGNAILELTDNNFEVFKKTSLYYSISNLAQSEIFNKITANKGA